MSSCAAERKIDFCSECEEYPCDELKEFQSAMPHRMELWSNLERIKSIGHKQWLEEIRGNYTCPQCQIVNSAYDLKCRKCGREPSCDYVARHRKVIEQYAKNRWPYPGDWTCMMFFLKSSFTKFSKYCTDQLKVTGEKSRDLWWARYRFSCHNWSAFWGIVFWPSSQAWLQRSYIETRRCRQRRDIEGRFSATGPLIESYDEKWVFECKRWTAGVPIAKLDIKIAWADAERPKHLVIIVSSHITNDTRKWLEQIAVQKTILSII